MIATKKTVCYSSQEKGIYHMLGGATVESTRVSQEAEEEGRAMGKGL